MSEEEQKVIENIENSIECLFFPSYFGEGSFIMNIELDDLKIILNLISKQQEIIKNQSYTNKKLRKKIKTIRKERNKLQKDLDLKDKVIDLAIKIIDNYENQLNICNFKSQDEIRKFLFEKAEVENE